MDVMDLANEALDLLEDYYEDPNLADGDLRQALANDVYYVCPTPDDSGAIAGFIADNPELLKHTIVASTERVGEIMAAAIRQYVFREAVDTNRFDNMLEALG